MKNIWLTSLIHDEALVQKVMSQLKTYGLNSNGHFWEDDLQKMGWIKPRGELLDQKTALWAILGTEADFNTPSLRYGLSMLALTVQAARGHDFPIVVLQAQGNSVSSGDLTTPLKGATVLSAAGSAYGAKLVAKVHGGSKEAMTPDYRLDIYGHEHIGQWFEVGPGQRNWTGGLFGVTGAEITFQAVGPKGSLPEKAELNYPIQDMKLNLNNTEYTAWAVQNAIDTETSYFIQVKGAPQSILFGPYTEEADAEVFVVTLK